MGTLGGIVTRAQFHSANEQPKQNRLGAAEIAARPGRLRLDVKESLVLKGKIRRAMPLDVDMFVFLFLPALPDHPYSATPGLP